MVRVIGLTFNVQDAEEVVGNFNGKNFLGSTIVVEYAKEGRSRPREPYEERGCVGFPFPYNPFDVDELMMQISSSKV